jgi:predicted transcriptional regulator
MHADYCSRSIFERSGMPEDEPIERGELLALTAEIVAAHIGRNAVARAQMPELIQSVFERCKASRRTRPRPPPSWPRRCRSSGR